MSIVVDHGVIFLVFIVFLFFFVVVWVVLSCTDHTPTHFHHLVTWRGLVCTIVVGCGGERNVLWAVLIVWVKPILVFHKKLWEMLKLFIITQLSERLRDLYYICQTIHWNTKKEKWDQCLLFYVFIFFPQNAWSSILLRHICMFTTIVDVKYMLPLTFFAPPFQPLV